MMARFTCEFKSSGKFEVFSWHVIGGNFSLE